MDKTVTATITREQIDQATVNYSLQEQAMAALERLVGTAESYGTFNIVRPNFSSNANPNVSFERKAA